MKKPIKLIVICTLLIANFAQAQWSLSKKIEGNGNVISQERTTAPYEEITVTGYFDVELVAGKEGVITVKGEENLLSFVKIEVMDRVLKIYTEKNKNISSSTGKGIVISVPFESINQVSLTGSGDVGTKNTIKSKSFAVKLTGSGNMDLEIEATAVNAYLTGSGNINLSGKTETVLSVVSGSGDLDSNKLLSKKATASVSGSGGNTVFCSESLFARVTGSGGIKYNGEPQEKDTKVTGSGSIAKL